MKKTVVFVVAISFLGVSLMAYFFYINKVSILNKSHITVEGLDEKIYFTQNIRGLNYNKVIISMYPIGRLTFNFDNSIVYSWDEKLFYKLIDDTLLIYCSNKAKVPKDFISKVKVKQIQYDIHKYNWLLANHKKEGLEVFPSKSY